MRTLAARWRPPTSSLISAPIAMVLAGVMWMIFMVAPEEATMGPVQRIVYFHVSVAWCGLAASIAMGVTGVLYLFTRRISWDHWSRAAAETGWLCTTLTLATGSLWAHEAWNTWWTWEPRLTSSLILWTIYAGYFLIRSALEDADVRGRICAVVALLAMADIPLILMATRWFRGIHPVTPEMDPRMRLVLMLSALSFTVFFAFLITFRQRQLETAHRAASVERRVGIESYA